MYKLEGWRRRQLVLSHCWSFFVGGWEDVVGLWVILLNMGYYTPYEKSCILEIEN